MSSSELVNVQEVSTQDVSEIKLLVFTEATKRYKYRQHDELYNERKYIEEVFEKGVNHNVDFNDTVAHFNNDSYSN